MDFHREVARPSRSESSQRRRSSSSLEIELESHEHHEAREIKTKPAGETTYNTYDLRLSAEEYRLLTGEARRRTQLSPDHGVRG